MESSATQAIYTGAYLFIFITALTVSIFLFNSVLDFSNLAYEYEEKIKQNEVLVNVPVEANRLLSADEVASYYYNYILKDKYTIENSKTNNTEIDKYYVSINGNNSAFLKNGQYISNYEDVMKVIGENNKYIIKYASISGNGKIYIEINKASTEQINQMR